jgi:hypothetical protein
MKVLAWLLVIVALGISCAAGLFASRAFSRVVAPYAVFNVEDVREKKIKTVKVTKTCDLLA